MGALAAWLAFTTPSAIGGQCRAGDERPLIRLAELVPKVSNTVKLILWPQDSASGTLLFATRYIRIIALAWRPNVQ